eukprot:TRINITY_DN5368_c0_g2_i3.p1 TRINITY_DN5368_c0_g2~~TRINITY_DN5368_c0_g2_i3.p1  ORF type:complete len:222 (+),score=44.99 TRINITY_DN5368_c0_g2_i3:42-668(+)
MAMNMNGPARLKKETLVSFIRECYFEIQCRSGTMFGVATMVRCVVPRLLAQGELVTEISPSLFAETTIDVMAQLLMNSVYTWEETVASHADNDFSFPQAKILVLSAAASACQKLCVDSEYLAQQLYKNMLKACILWPFEKEVVPESIGKVESLEQTIPDACRDFICVQQILEDFVVDVIDEVIEKTVTAAMASHSQVLKKTFAELLLS